MTEIQGKSILVRVSATFDLCNIVPRVGTRSESMSALFGKVAKSEYPDPKRDVAFLRYEKTLTIDPTFWFLNFLLVA